MFHRRELSKRQWCGQMESARLGICFFLLCVATAVASSAQTFATLINFNGTNGKDPLASLVQGTDGELYGTTTEGGGANRLGNVFKITMKGKVTTLHRFCAPGSCMGGNLPYAALIQASDGNFYGTTAGGGTAEFGTVFKITPEGKLTTLYSFCAKAGCADGGQPLAGLIQASNGNFYGTTFLGGANGGGTVFEITPNGKLTVRYSFCGQPKCAEGNSPAAKLLQAIDGSLYGTTEIGGTNGWGTVFKVTTGGAFTTLYSFCAQTKCADGAQPNAGLIQAANGEFYGTTLWGGTDGQGTVFKITAGGSLTTLYSFCAQSNCADGANPTSELIQATDGNLYGTTSRGGQSGDGTVFKMTPVGALTTLHSFDGTDGADPVGGLVQATNGTFYGTTSIDGSYLDGTLFGLSVGLSEFVETRPTSGKVGTKVIILGTNLKGATGVTFNGIPAKFTVASKSQIKTNVPEGATTGRVKVKMPNRTLASNVVFRVTR